MRRLCPAAAFLACLLSLTNLLAQGTETTGPPRTSATPQASPAGWKLSDTFTFSDILAIIFAPATFLSLYFAWKQHQKAEENKQKADKAEAEAKALADRLIYKIGYVALSAVIDDVDGSLTTTWKWEDIQLVKQGATLSYLPGGLWFDPPECEFIDYPDLIAPDPGRRLELDVFRRQKNSCRYNLVIEGNLNYGETIKYEYKAKVSKGFFMTVEDVETYGSPTFRKKEYWGFLVTTPVDEIEITVDFPPGYAVQTFVGVCIGEIPSDRLMQSDEVQRIRANNWFQSGIKRAWLKVEKPFVGLSYLIFWEPLPKRLVDTKGATSVTFSTVKGGQDDGSV